MKRRAGFSIVLAVFAALCAIAAAAPRGKSRPRPAAPASSRAAPSGCPSLAPASPTTAQLDPAPLAASSIAVSLPIALSAIQPELDRLIPNLSDPNWNHVHPVADNLCATWFFDRQPVALKLDGNRLRITIPGEFGMIAGPYTSVFGCSRPYVGCGDKTAGARPIPVQLRLSTELSITPAYRVAVALQNDGTAFVQPCSLVGGLDGTQQVGSVIDGTIAQQLATLNATIAGKADFRPRIEAAWTAIQRPQRAGDDLWLVVRPSELLGGVSALDPGTLSVQAIARGTIELIKQPTAPAVTPVPLPALAPAPPPPPGIHVGVSGTTSYDALTKQLQAQLAGKTESVEYPSGTSHSVEIRGARVTGPVRCKAAKRTPKCITVAVEFAGDACGVAYLVGRPVVDAEKQEISIEDLEFSVETSDALVARLAWLGHGAIVERLRRELRIPLAAAATEAKQRLGHALKAKLAGDWKLTGSADSATFSVAIGATGLDYAIDLSGTLAVTVGP